MPKLIKNGQFQPDGWTLIRVQEDGSLPEIANGADVIVPLPLWLKDRAGFASRQGKVGVWLAPADEPEQLQVDLAQLPLVAIDFPVFTDGRGYSQARLLRERYGYQGELRAVGDVWEDLIHPLWQVGFDSFVIKDGKDPAKPAGAYNTFSERYQVTYQQPVPLFRRRVI
jgi:uncharacterized protein (DUF934 family)